MAMVKKLPATETGPGVRCVTRNEGVYIVSQCMVPRRFTLWKEYEGKGYEKLGTADSPLDLYEKIPWGT